MGQKLIEESLRLLDEVKEDLSNDAPESALDGLDEVVVLLRKAKEEKIDRTLLKKQILESLPQVAQASGRIASLIETLLHILQ